MTGIPAGQSPFVVYVEAVVQVEMLVHAEDLAAARDIANHHGPAMVALLRERVGLDVASPYVATDVDAREATYAEVMGTTEPDHYGPLEPYFTTLIRDPEDDAFDPPEVPDYLPPNI